MPGSCVQLRSGESYKAFNARLATACAALGGPLSARLATTDGIPTVFLVPEDPGEFTPIACAVVPLAIERERESGPETPTALEEVMARALELAGDRLVTVDLEPELAPTHALVVWTAESAAARPATLTSNPPFGYRRVQGRPVIEPDEADQVLAVLAAEDAGASKRDALRTFAQNRAVSSEALDKRAARILANREIYTHGRFLGEDGQLHDYPDLVIADPAASSAEG